MNRGKDIQTEIDNYIKGNYPKNTAVELLKRDGFSESEINEHISKLDIVEKSNAMSYKFVPGFLFIVLISLLLLSMSMGNSSEENSYSTISLIGFILAIPLLYFYHKGNKLAILFTSLVISCFILLNIIALFNSFSSIFSTSFILICTDIVFS